MVVGKVALDDEVEKAVIITTRTLLKKASGLRRETSLSASE